MSAFVVLSAARPAFDLAPRAAELSAAGTTSVRVADPVDAARHAAASGAARCEIHGAPGLYTADPELVPEARRLLRLDYDEAQELLTTRPGHLDPRCLGPLREVGVPLELHAEAGQPPTRVERVAESGEVRALTLRRGVVLVSMDTLGMWQQVGFLADVFDVFRRHGVSVDLVSTSESNVTASIDAGAAVSGERLAALLGDLAPHCRARAIGPCAAVGLVGRGIRAALHRLGPALTVFEDRRIHLVAQSASDLNLTFVVDEADAPRLVGRLHALLFADREAPHLGASRRPLARYERWWERRRDELLATEATPAYVYAAEELDRAAAGLTSLASVDRVLYAVKANDHPAVLRRLQAGGVGFECVSPGEIDRVFEACPGLSPDDVLFTPNFAPRREYADALERGVWLTVDNLHPLEAWPEVFAGRDVLLRLDPGRGRGHHPKVRTAGRRSKFGIAPEQLDAVSEAVARAGAKVVGLHAHVGSGVRDPEAWPEVARFLAEATGRFPDVRLLDLGGGLGVREKPGQGALDLVALDAALGAFKRGRPDLALWLEPGRYLVSEAGVLLARVTQTKLKGDRRYIGVDAGMHTLIRPALYGAWHEVVNLTRLGEPATITADVVGPVCETGDTLAHDRRLPETFEGDLLLIGTAGAYGRTMSSAYNRRPPPLELLI